MRCYVNGLTRILIRRRDGLNKRRTLTLPPKDPRDVAMSSSGEDPMEYLAKMKAKMAGIAEMQEVAAQQAAIANNVKARMAKINALLEGGSGGSVSSSASSSASSSRLSSSLSYGGRGNGSTASNENVNPDTQGMTAKEEEEYWKRKIAMLSQPVTANGLGSTNTGSSHVSSSSVSSTYAPQNSQRGSGVLARAIASGSSAHAAAKYNEPRRSSPLTHKPSRNPQPVRSPAARRQRSVLDLRVQRRPAGCHRPHLPTFEVLSQTGGAITLESRSAPRHMDFQRHPLAGPEQRIRKAAVITCTMPEEKPDGRRIGREICIKSKSVFESHTRHRSRI